jgi:hypothetical protein
MVPEGIRVGDEGGERVGRGPSDVARGDGEIEGVERGELKPVGVGVGV